MQASPAQMAVVIGALPDVGSQRREGVRVGARLAGGPMPVEVDPDGLAVMADAACDR